jgi:transketolase
MPDPILDCAQMFSRTLLELAEVDERICVVLNDSAETHHLEPFFHKFPERVIDVGIAEQNMVGIAAGLANSGRVPFVHSASCFLARAHEQIKNDVAYSNSNVKLCGFVAGLAYGPCGGTHHAVDDIAWTRAIPNLAVVAPATPNDTAAALRAVLARPGPAFLRIISKVVVPELFPDAHEFTPSSWLRRGTDVALIGTGVMTSRLVEAAHRLSEQSIDAGVLHIASISPLDRNVIAMAAKAYGRIVIVEEHVVNGGLGGAVSEVIVQTEPVPALLIGVPNVYAPIGPASFLYEHFGLTAPQIAARVNEWLSELGRRPPVFRAERKGQRDVRVDSPRVAAGS